MTNAHPITPPPELVGEWLCADGYPWDPSANAVITITTGRLSNIATQAARWGADHELDACCDAIYEHEGQPLCGGTAEWLRAARRPKPPSLKEQALAVLMNADGADHPVPVLVLPADEAAIIRRAIEALPDTP